MRMNKFIHIIVFGIFLSFAAVQYNDSDAWQWILLYISIAIIPLLKVLNLKSRGYIIAINILLVVLFISQFHLYSNWISAGRPAFIDYEPTEVKAVEDIREFLGIVICMVCALAYLISEFLRR